MRTEYHFEIKILRVFITLKNYLKSWRIFKLHFRDVFYAKAKNQTFLQMSFANYLCPKRLIICKHFKKLEQRN